MGVDVGVSPVFNVATILRTGFLLGLISLATGSLTTSVRAAEIKVFALQSPQIVMGELAGDFEHRTGYKIIQLSKTTESPAAVKARIDAGESFDAACLTTSVLDQLIKDGKLVADTRTNFMRVPIGVAVRSGAPKPDISTVEAFKRTLLNAKSIAYLKGFSSGPYLEALFDRWGIGAELQQKAKRPDTDIVGELVARGEAEIGVTAIATMMATKGVDVVGPIPSEIQSPVLFACAVGASAAAPDVARDLIKLLTGPAAIPVFRAKGMEPW
jgi:molybdate transport system substrate-binding protein